MKQKFTTRVLAEVAIFAALAFALDALQGGIWKGVFPNGGSIGLAMVPIFIICYRRGLLAGLACGFLLSIVQMIPGIYIINAGGLDNPFLKVAGPFIQVMLDYVLAYTVVGLAGVFSKKYLSNPSKGMAPLLVGVTLGGLLKYACHVVAGLLFWPGEIFGISGAGYSFVYNGLYQIPNIVISIILMVLLTKFYPSILVPKDLEVSVNE